MSNSAFLEPFHKRQNVVSTKWLFERFESPDVAIVDASVAKGLGDGEIWVSDRATFEAGHIPGARFADLVSDFSDPKERFALTRPSAASFASAARAIGLTCRP